MDGRRVGVKFCIRTIRKRTGMKQEELARRAGISRITLCGLESGRITNTQTKTLERIAAVLGVEVKSLFQ